MADIAGSYQTDEDYPRDPFAQFQPPPGAQTAGPQAQPAPVRPPQPAQPAQPQVPELPWGPSDQAELSRLQNSLSQIEKDQASGVIAGGTGLLAAAQIAPRLQKLQAKQARQMAQAAQQAQKQMMQGMAQQEAIETVHRSRRANDFPRTVAKYEDFDPMTGEVQTAHFYQDVKGNWKQIEFPERPEVFNPPDVGYVPASETMAEPPPPFVPATGSNPPSSILAAGANANSAPTLAGPLSLEQFGAQQRQQAQGVDPATFEQTIQSGPYTDRYRGGQLVSSDRPPRTGSAPGGDVFSPEALKKAFELADRHVPQLPGGANEHMQLHRLQTVHNVATQILNRANINLEHQRAAQRATTEKQRQEAVRVAENQRQEDVRRQERLEREQARKDEQQRKTANGGLSDTQLSQLRLRIAGQVRAERDREIKERQKTGAVGAATLPNSPSPSGVRPELQEQNEAQEIDRRLQEHLGHLRALQGKAAPQKATEPAVLPPGVNLDAARHLEELLGKQSGAGVQPPVPAPAPMGPMVQEEAVSRPTPQEDRMGNILSTIRQIQARSGWRQNFFGPLLNSGPYDALSRMEGILARARARNRPLTAEEKAEYRRQYARLPDSDVTAQLALE